MALNDILARMDSLLTIWFIIQEKVTGAGNQPVNQVKEKDKANSGALVNQAKEEDETNSGAGNQPVNQVKDEDETNSTNLKPNQAQMLMDGVSYYGKFS